MKYSIIKAIELGTQYLERKNIESPRLLTEIFLTEILNCSRMNLYANFDKPISDNEIERLNLMMRKSANNEPYQYILGYTQFCNLKIDVQPGVLIPRPETEELVELVINRIRLNSNIQNILDIGTGSGCIALALSSAFPQKNIYGIDIEKDALNIAIKNRDRLGLNAKFKLLDILTEKPKMKFDCIISNPPYIPLTDYTNLDLNVKNFEPKSALTDGGDGLNFYRSFAELMPDILDNNGFFAFEIGDTQANEVKNIFSKQFNIDIIFDICGKERFVFGVFSN